MKQLDKDKQEVKRWVKRMALSPEQKKSVAKAAEKALERYWDLNKYKTEAA